MKEKNSFNYTLFSKENIDRQFHEIQDKLKPSMNHKVIMEKFHNILKNRIIPTLVYDSKSDEFTIYRITKPWHNFNIEEPSSYSYNPKPKENGRAHIKGAPVFYGAINPYTAFSEMKDTLKVGDTFYLSEWKLKFNSNINVHSLIINSSTTKNNHPLNSLIKTPHNLIKNMFQGVPDNYREGNIYAIEKLGDLYATKGNRNYHITSAYSYDILYNLKSKGLNIPILIYPSVENSLNGINWAIHPSIIDTGQMVLKDVFEATLKENNTKNKKQDISITIQKKGTLTSKNKFIWKRPEYRDIMIDYDGINVCTYNNEIINNEIINNEIEKIRVENSIITIKYFLDSILSKKQIHKMISEAPAESEEVSELDFEKQKMKRLFMIEFNEGYQIKTKKGYSSIKYICIPISWSREYKPIKSS